MNPKYKKLIEKKGLDNVVIDLIKRIEKLEQTKLTEVKKCQKSF